MREFFDDPQSSSWYPLVKFISKNCFTVSEVISGVSVNFLLILSHRFPLIIATVHACMRVLKKEKQQKEGFLDDSLQAFFKGFLEAMETKQGVEMIKFLMENI